MKQSQAFYAKSYFAIDSGERQVCWRTCHPLSQCCLWGATKTGAVCLPKGQGHNLAFVAIDGRCASGKTTLAGQIQAAAQCNMVHIDDFYLPFSLQTEERMAQPGGIIDFDRLLSEVLFP